MSQLQEENASTPPLDPDQSTMSEEERDAKVMDINETGHVQALERNFSLLSVCSVGIVTGNTWAALGGSIAVAIYNGGPPGILYEFIVVSIFYALIAASIAELASSIPSSAGVYHWASVTPGPKYGRVCGFFAGYWNTAAWLCGSATMASIGAQIVTAMYGIYHSEYTPERWHVFIVYFIFTWICCCTVLFANRALPMINNVGLLFILGGVFITILVCAVMPQHNGNGYASSSFVWADWSNATGYSSNGFVFLAGMLNGAYAVGTPDCVSHLAEEIPQPRRNIPLAIGAQMVIGFATAFLYMIAIFYSISDLDAVLAAPYFPLAQIYAQATTSNAGTFGLLLVILIPILCTCIGTFITAGRCLWTLARDDAVPCSGTISKVSSRFHNPYNATLICGIFCTILGLIYVGSITAFNAFVGSFVVLSTLSYVAAILPFIFTRRFSRTGEPPGPYINSMKPGPFRMSNLMGYTVNVFSCVYILVFIVIYCFPSTMPFTAAQMNYTCLIAGALTLFAGVVWWVKGGNYVGPKAMLSEEVPPLDINVNIETVF